MMTDSAEPHDHPAALTNEQLKSDCELRFQRRSGPGGQHRNKVETSVHLEHRPTGVKAAASERRAQGENLKVALRRLRIQLALDVRADWRAPSPLWTARAGGGKLAVSDQHQVFPSLLAEALDALGHCQWHHQAAAHALGCTASQLIKFLQREPAALKRLNEHRAAAGLGRLR